MSLQLMIVSDRWDSQLFLPFREEVADGKLDISGENDPADPEEAAAALAGTTITVQQPRTYAEKYEAAKKKWSSYIINELGSTYLTPDAYEADLRTSAGPASGAYAIRKSRWWPNALLRGKQDLECALRGLELIKVDEKIDYELCEEDMRSSAFIEAGRMWVHGNFKAREKGSSEVEWFFAEIYSSGDPDNCFVARACCSLSDDVVAREDALFGCRACVRIKHPDDIKFNQAQEASTDPLGAFSPVGISTWLSDKWVRRKQDLECALRGLKHLKEEYKEKEPADLDYELCEEDMSSSGSMDTDGRLWLHGNFKARELGSSEVQWFFAEIMSTGDPDCCYKATVCCILPATVVKMEDALFGCRACVHIKHPDHVIFNRGCRPLVFPRVTVQKN